MLNKRKEATTKKGANKVDSPKVKLYFACLYFLSDLLRKS